MTNTEELEKLIKASGLKKTYIAEKIGISRFSLIKKVNNTTAFTAIEIAALCDVLNIKDLEEKEKIFFARQLN